MSYRMLPLIFLSAVCSIAAAAGQTAAPASEGASDGVRGALKHVLDSNAQFVARHDPDYFQPFTDKQTPLATVVGCSDSRVQMHAVDRHPDNDVFVIRNIGNQLATAEGSVEYGVRHLHTPLLLFIGHSGCGAVTAALGDYSGESEPIRRELDTLNVTKGNPVPQEVVANVHHQVAAAKKLFAPEVEAGSLAVVGAVYDFRDDYHQGQGRLILVNLNGETDPAKIERSPLLEGIEDVHVHGVAP